LSNKIHPTAIVGSKAELGLDVEVGPFSIIEDDVRIGSGSVIASSVLVAAGTRLGSGCKVSHGAVLGTAPQDLKFGGEATELVIGDNTVIREYATLNRGTAAGHKVTKVGANCMLMAYTHVAHDCSLGDNVIFTNNVSLAGHVEVEDWVSIGGFTVIHQFVKVGRHSYLGGRCRVTQDIPPFILTSGEPMGYYGPNSIGLRRRGFSNEQIHSIKEAYRYIYRSKLNLKQAVEAIKSEVEQTEEVKQILDFIARAKRGLSGLGVENQGEITG